MRRFPILVFLLLAGVLITQESPGGTVALIPPVLDGVPYDFQPFTAKLQELVPSATIVPYLGYDPTSSINDDYRLYESFLGDDAVDVLVLLPAGNEPLKVFESDEKPTRIIAPENALQFLAGRFPIWQLEIPQTELAYLIEACLTKQVKRGRRVQVSSLKGYQDSKVRLVGQIDEILPDGSALTTIDGSLLEHIGAVSNTKLFTILGRWSMQILLTDSIADLRKGLPYLTIDQSGAIKVGRKQADLATRFKLRPGDPFILRNE